MITNENLSNFENSIYNIDITVNTPLSGFEFSLMETGVAGTFKTANLVTFSGQEGYLFDQSGNFFGGYDSGMPFNLKVYYDYDNTSFSYYWNDVLMANSLDVTGWSVFETGKVNLISFDKHGDSSLSLTVTGSNS